jgi:purine-binding chemotaxis protein CheW
MPTNDLEQVVTEVSKVTSESELSKDDDKLKLLIFSLGEEEYAVDIKDLQEIILMPNITPIPNAPDFISGILNLRGGIVVVVDLESRFHMKRADKVAQKHVVVAKVGESDFGVSVDEVREMIKVRPDEIQPTPELVSSKIHAEYLKGVVVLEKKGKKKSRLLILLDLQKLLQEKELLAAQEGAKSAEIPEEAPKEAPDSKQIKNNLITKNNEYRRKDSDR